MGKRESIKKPRLERDLYPTIDPDAVKPLLHLDQNYIEPCAGGGDLIDLLNAQDISICVGAYDIDPQREGIVQRNCLSLTKEDVSEADCFITNPPYAWDMLQPMLDFLPLLLPTWMLLPSDMAHNKRMGRYMRKCSDILSIGRLSWFRDESGKFVKGVDNYCWFRFVSWEPNGCFFKGRM